MLVQFGGERCWGCVAKGGVRSLPVVVLDLGGDLDPRLRKAREQASVENLVAYGTVRIRGVAVLHWLARSEAIPR